MSKKGFLILIAFLMGACTSTPKGIDDSIVAILPATEETVPSFTPTQAGEEATVTVASSQSTETPTPTSLPEPTQTPESRPMTPEQEAAYALLDREAESKHFMEEYPMAESKEFTGSAYGLDIKFVIATSQLSLDDPHHPITGFDVTKEEADAVVDYWLRASHFRYVSQMGKNISFEDYIELLKKPEGGEIYMPVRESDGQGNWSVVWRYIDPRKGFSAAHYPESEEMPIAFREGAIAQREDENQMTSFEEGFVLGVDASGRLFVVDNLDFFNGQENIKDPLWLQQNTDLDDDLEAGDLVGYKKIWSLLTSAISRYELYSDECLVLDNMAVCQKNNYDKEVLIENFIPVFDLEEQYYTNVISRPFTLVGLVKDN